MIRSIPVSCPAYRNLTDANWPEIPVKSAINLSEFILSSPLTHHEYHVSKNYDIERSVTGLQDRLDIVVIGVIGSSFLIACSIYLILFSIFIFAVAQKISNSIKDLPPVKSGVEFYKRSIVPALEKIPDLPALPKLSFAHAAKIVAPSLIVLKTINRFQINAALIDKAFNTPRPQDEEAIRTHQERANELVTENTELLRENQHLTNQNSDRQSIIDTLISQKSNLESTCYSLKLQNGTLKGQNQLLTAANRGLQELLAKGSLGKTPVIEWANLTHQETKNRIAQFLEELIETRDPNCWSTLEDIIQKHVISPQAQSLLLKGVSALKENRPFIVEKSDLPLLHENAYSTCPIIMQVLANILFKKRTMQDSIGKVESPYDPYKDKEAYIHQHYQEGQLRALLLQGIQALRSGTPRQLLSKYESLLKEHKMKCDISISPLIQEILDNQSA
jgi:hypothetical protein